VSVEHGELYSWKDRRCATFLIEIFLTARDRQVEQKPQAEIGRMVALRGFSGSSSPSRQGRDRDRDFRGRRRGPDLFRVDQAGTSGMLSRVLLAEAPSLTTPPGRFTARTAASDENSQNEGPAEGSDDGAVVVPARHVPAPSRTGAAGTTLAAVPRPYRTPRSVLRRAATGTFHRLGQNRRPGPGRPARHSRERSRRLWSYATDRSPRMQVQLARFRVRRRAAIRPQDDLLNRS